MTVTPASEIPIDKLKLPPGFKIEVWATGMPGARAMARGDDGRIYIGTRAIGRVYELTDNGKERTSRVVVDKLVQPAGVAFIEQMGTNLRATATTAAPNLVRGMVLPMTWLFRGLAEPFGVVAAAIGTGLVVFFTAIVALSLLHETFGRDLDFLEE
jgi:hypothetical protein